MALRPVSHRVTQPYGVANSAYRLGFHPGTDYGSPAGTPIKATTDGKVVYYPGNNGGYGNVAALIRHTGDVVWHSHLSRPGKTGNVKKGQHIGFTGNTGWSTGPHLHVEYRVGGNQNRPINFEKWLKDHPEKKKAKPAPPKPVYYRVVRGDTLTSIARKFKTTLTILLQKNTKYKKNPNKINVGDKVRVKN